MRVIRFGSCQPDAANLGLTEFSMQRLGQVVVLAGPNGGGKTRTLTLLRDSLGALHQQYRARSEDLRSTIKAQEQELANSSHSEGDRKSHQSLIDNYRRILSVRQNLELSSEKHGQISVATFSAVATNLRDPQGTTRDQLRNSYDSASSVLGTGKLKSDALAYIDYVASRCWNAKHPDTTEAADGERRAAIEAWEELKSLITVLLSGATLGRGVDGVALINGRPGASGLSDGQKALLVAATTLHAQRMKLDETIILVDEPETHLHPSAQIEFIDRLIQATPKGQVWIATHSVHILSHVHPDSLWFVESGSITWAGKKPGVVLSRLVGDEERVGRLERFLHLPAVFAMERFVAECLSTPTIASTGAEDPQSTQIREIIWEVSKDSKLRVLDYGAGKGRILAALREGTDDLATKVDYRGYEMDEAARAECVGAIAEAYGVSSADAADRVYGEEGSLRSHLNRGSVDVIVMCNVLHEIEPRKWPNLFTGIIRHCLREDGYLLIVEDMYIPHGEHAHRHGFILLDAEQLQELFEVDRENLQQFRSYGDKRLKAHLVRADVLTNVTTTTVKIALERRRASARDEIQRIRAKEPSFANGHLLGLYAMLHANASLALDEP